ncbi:extracellular solute-binding protein [Paragemmobacter straminiformis]|uniref:ABC transporter substrate-binding protein n=1 Tax=Paragemmobacter straminiformis TaxID=2045119 RepID=A0A842I489_9RHOB|nr:extracellular solute-binding protein [Gemmobacter straminiformis]MBC2834660.1 ABC transporter substrate-binding protein [Gemmobacter straminiformis]
MAVVRAKAIDGGFVRWAGAGFLALVLAGFAVAARAEDGVTVSHAITTFGDPPKYPADFQHLDYVNPDAPKGGEISIWTSGGFDSLNPYSVKGRAAALASAPYESILTGTSDEIGTSYCLLCTTMEYPADRSWVIFNLRPEAKFSDGTPLTAEDVVFSYNVFLEKGLTDFRTIFGQQVQGAEILDPHRVKFTFKPGVPTRDLPASVGGLSVFSKAQYEREGLDLEESSMKPFLGSGPYVLDKLDMSKSITWKLNPDYWGKDLPINRGRNNFDRIRVEYYGDYQAAFEGFKAGNYTFRNEASSITWATGYDFPAVASGQVIKTELPSGAKASGQAFLFNLRKEKFQDPRVREALGMMFNFEWSNQTLFYALYARINSVWENTDMAATGVPSPDEAAILQPLVDDGTLPASILTDEAVVAPVSGERQLDRKNLRAASALLDEAGWTVGDDGIRRNAKGETLRVEFLNDSPSFDRVITPYIENLKALGVDAYMTTVDDAQMESRTRPPAYDFDMITGNARSDYIPGSDLKQYYGSATSDVSAFNLMGLKSPAVDRLIDVVMAADSNDKMKVATRALDRVLRAERFWVPQWYKNKHTVAYYDMYEHPAELPPYSSGELDFWWYNAEKGEALKAAGVFK